MKGPRPRLTEVDVRSIRREHARIGSRRLARRYKVTMRTIQLIVTRERWGWL